MVTRMISFEELDLMLGNHAPFLMSLSDGLQEELHIVIAAAEVGDVGSNIPDFEGVNESTRQALHEILADTQPIKANERRLFEICFHDYIIWRPTRSPSWEVSYHF